MNYAIVPIQKLMTQWEKIVAECKVGIYVSQMSNGIIGYHKYTIRLIRYDQRDEVKKVME